MSKKQVLLLHFLITFIFLLPLWLNYQPPINKYFHRGPKAILEKTGFFDYVDTNIDVITYHYTYTFWVISLDYKGQKVEKEVFGAAYPPCLGCERRVAIALLSKPDYEIARILVHEAAHQYFWSKFGYEESLEQHIENEYYAIDMHELFLIRYNQRQVEEVYLHTRSTTMDDRFLYVIPRPAPLF